MLGTVQLCQQDAERAAALHPQALEIARQIGARYPEAEALNGLAAAQTNLGSLDEVLDNAQAALALAHQFGYRVLEGHATFRCATAALIRGDHATGVKDAGHAVEIHRATGHRLGIVAALTLLGHAYRAGGDPESACDCQRQARVVRAELGVNHASRPQNQ